MLSFSSADFCGTILPMDKEPSSFPEVVCLVFFRNGKLLLEQRLDDDAFYGRWTFTGGKIEDGESVEEASIREAGEETGLAPLSIQCLVSFRGVSRNGNSYLFHGVLVKEWGGRLVNREGSQKRRLKWVPL